MSGKFITKITAILFAAIAAFALVSKTRASAFSAYDGEKEVYLARGSFSESVISAREKGFSAALLRKKGEACFIKNAKREDIAKDFAAEFVFSEESAEETSYYYYSEKLPYTENDCGKKVNLQISERGNGVKAGTPLIYGSF